MSEQTVPPCPASLPQRRSDAHKGSCGRVLLIGGSRGMAGSISLSAVAALRSGSGLVSAAVPDAILETVAGFHPGVMTIPLADNQTTGTFAATAQLPDLSAYDAIGIGPGMQTGTGSVKLITAILSQTQLPRVIDADGLNVIAAQNLLAADPQDATVDQQRTLILTPHPGELARLTGIPATDRAAQIDAAQRLATQHGLTVVVKGGPTVIVTPQQAGRSTNPTGNPGMATAGSGDVLTGVITSLLGQGMPTEAAAKLGVYLHGLAGDFAARKHGQASMICTDLLDSLSQSIQASESATSSPSP